MYEELVENLKSLRENYFQTQDDDNFCFSAVDADMLESAAEVIEDLELVSRSQQAACNQLAEAIEKLQSELEQVKAEKEAALRDFKKIAQEGLCTVCEHYNCDLSDTICADCKGTPYIITDNFQWRGVQGGKDD